jgi:sialate O-acetylesterase
MAEVKLTNLFSDNMVLQRELPAPIFGTASPGEKVSVTFDGQTLETVAGADGNWMVKLSSFKTSKTGKEMVIKGSNTITLNNILVGEVWLCSGQSNMAGKFATAKGRGIDPKAFEKDHSGLRFSSKNGGWEVFTPDSQSRCSRVGYYFGMRLYEELGIPVGLIQRATSGSPIQSWMPVSAAEEIRIELGIPKHWGDPRKPDTAGKEYDAWIETIIPVSFRGVTWYQGERNAKTQTGWEYRHLLPHLIETWRKTWAAKAGIPLRGFPFYYVQVPSQAPDQEYPWLRDAMRRALDLTENTGVAIFYDHGPGLHPENKKPAGERLALWALAKDYGRTDLVHCGPLLDAVTFNGNKAVLTFKHVGVGLKSVSGEKRLRFFEIAGADAEYASANAEIVGDTVVVQSDKIAKPVYVRYLFRKAEPNAEFSLMNAEGIPASSFITDDFKPHREPLEEISAEQLAADRKEAEQKKERLEKKRTGRKKKARK